MAGLFGKTKLREVAEIISTEEIEYHLAIVRATLIKKDEVFDFWKKYHDENNDIVARINALETNLDERVYEIYGLTPDQIAVVLGYFVGVTMADDAAA